MHNMEIVAFQNVVVTYNPHSKGFTRIVTDLRYRPLRCFFLSMGVFIYPEELKALKIDSMQPINKRTRKVFHHVVFLIPWKKKYMAHRAVYRLSKIRIFLENKLNTF